MSHIFISYIEEDGAIAKEIADELESVGFNTWRYERDAIVGVSYLEVTRRAVLEADAFLIVITEKSLESGQVRAELVSAFESRKPMIPLRVGISDAEYKKRKPEWAQMIGAYTSTEIQPGNVSAKINNLKKGLISLNAASPGQNAFELLGLPATADAGAIQTRYNQIKQQLLASLNQQTDESSKSQLELKLSQLEIAKTNLDERLKNKINRQGTAKERVTLPETSDRKVKFLYALLGILFLLLVIISMFYWQQMIQNAYAERTINSLTDKLKKAEELTENKKFVIRNDCMHPITLQWLLVSYKTADGNLVKYGEEDNRIINPGETLTIKNENGAFAGWNGEVISYAFELVYENERWHWAGLWAKDQNQEGVLVINLDSKK